jgi:cyclopropane-fatty-acyl-phospholipid synthase
MLAPAGIRINGADPWDIQVHDRRWYRRILREKNLGLGESYMDGWWDCAQLDELFCRLPKSGMEERISGGLLYLGRLLPGNLVHLQSKQRSRMVADRHYNLGNELFLTFLDAHQQYSCGYFPGHRRRPCLPGTSDSRRHGNS